MSVSCTQTHTHTRTTTHTHTYTHVRVTHTCPLSHHAAGAPNPLSVVAAFASNFFKHTSRGDLLKYLRTQFHVVAELPILEAADDDPQRRVGRHDLK